MRKTVVQLAWFIIVGCAAALTHWLVVVTLVQQASWKPLLANVAGWLIAFVVSFAGHYRLTFRHQPIPWQIALRRFFVVSATGFSVNETAYALLLHISHASYSLLLAIILVAIAFLTYLVSRIWAFRHS